MNGEASRRDVRRERAWAIGSGLLLWAAFPPLKLWPLAWVAPLGWLHLIRQSAWTSSRPYWMIYGAGVLHWLLLVQWIRLPHWSAHFGWLALSAYLGGYIPLFIAGSRQLVHRFRVPLWLAAAMVWVGLEWVRGYLLTGFSLSLLGHSQVSWASLLQVAEWAGAYGVSFLVMATAGIIYALIPWQRTWLARRKSTTSEQRPSGALKVWAVAAVWIGLLGVVCGWGRSRIEQMTAADPSRAPLHVALIQGALDTTFDDDQPQRAQQAFFDYVRLSRQAATEQPDLDLIIWPESMFTANETMISYTEPLAPIPEWDGTLDELKQRLDLRRANVEARFAWVARQTTTPMIVGMEWNHVRAGQMLRYNSALLIGKQGKLQGRYDKMHPVMFGEYVPFANWAPWLYRLTPMASGLEAGDGPRVFDVAGYLLSPAICFENTVPHLIRRQVRQLEQAGKRPDILTTITNDGWFWGSSLLDVHLACGVFRAIEMRRPMLIAANTGFSASIDMAGQIKQRGPRRAEAVIHTEIATAKQQGPTIYLRYGDWFAAGCFSIVVLAVVASCLTDRLERGRRGDRQTVISNNS